MTLAAFDRLHQRIEEKSSDISAAPVLIIAFGDSVTQGFTTLGHLDPKAVYHNRLKIMLEEKYPLATFSVINAGVGGETATDALERLDRDVIRYQGDLVIIGFALNDAFDGRDGREKYRQSLRRIIRTIREKTDADIVMLTPNFMTTGNNPHITAVQQNQSEAFIQIQDSGILAEYAADARKVADEFNVPVADVFAEWETLARKGCDTNAMLANKHNHPTSAAQEIPARLLAQCIG